MVWAVRIDSKSRTGGAFFWKKTVKQLQMHSYPCSESQHVVKMQFYTSPCNLLKSYSKVAQCVHTLTCYCNGGETQLWMIRASAGGARSTYFVLIALRDWFFLFLDWIGKIQFRLMHTQWSVDHHSGSIDEAQLQAETYISSNLNMS